MTKCSAFRIIAIRPLVGCSQRYLKVLKAGQIYKFYNDYEFLNKDGKPVKGNEDVVDIKDNYNTPAGLYNIKRKGKEYLRVNISAIVGKNGSGKSSLIELLFMAINNIAKKYIDDDVKPLSNVVSVFEKRGIRLCIELYFSTDKTYKLVIRDSAYDDENYMLGTSVYVLKNKKFVKDESFSLKDFFYTIAINYSSFSLDHRELGDWIKELFWKNDAYQTPIVINPFRENGHIDHENEKSLVKDRLLANVLRSNSNNNFNYTDFTDKQKVKSISLKLNSENYNSKVIYEEKQVFPTLKKEKIIITISDISIHKKRFFKISEDLFDYDFNSIYEKGNEVLVKSLDYLFYKAFKIGHTYFYEEFKTIFDFPNKKILKDKEFDVFIKSLFSKEGSHITFKIRQVANFIRHNETNLIKTKNKIDLNVNDLSNNIDEIILKENSKNVNRIEFIPPPIYDIDYNLISTETKNEEETKFSLLSSGEQQKIYSISSILYHLINIDSVKDDDLIKYKNVNIIFEEIELYFHPEMQRTFISSLHENIKNLTLNNIDNINISLVTHSPFILSDIPSSNILYLDVRKKDNDQTPLAYPEYNKGNTFGANIHDLLANSFFMEGGFMGEFAKDRINSTICFLTRKNRNDNYRWSKNKIKTFINTIGEPIIRDSLLDLYNERYFKDYEEIDQEIKRLQELKRNRKK